VEICKKALPSFCRGQEIRERTPAAQYVAFHIQINDPIEFAGNQLSGVSIHGINQDFEKIQVIEIAHGRSFLEREFDNAANVGLIGYEAAEKLFGKPELAEDKFVEVRGKKSFSNRYNSKTGQEYAGRWRLAI